MRAAQLKHDKEVAEKQASAKAAQEKADQWTNSCNSFIEMIQNSVDLSDQLQNLNDHLRVGTKATACYIGKMVLPKNKISDTDLDNAHLNSEATPQI